MLRKSGYKQGEAVLRFKSPEGMKHKNPAFRDFPLARINLTNHPRQKNKYRVWPMMDLGVTTDDIEQKIIITPLIDSHNINPDIILTAHPSIKQSIDPTAMLF